MTRSDTNSNARGRRSDLRSRPLRALVPAAVALPLTVGAPAAVAAPSGDGDTSLEQRTLTVTGSSSRTGTFTLHHDSAVLLQADGPGSSQVRVQGNGRAVGLVARRVGPGPEATFGAFLANACFTPGCRPDGVKQIPFTLVTGSLISTGSSQPRLLLPAGTYRTTLMADGAPVTVRIALSGLPSSMTLRPAGPAAVSYSNVPQQTGPAPAHLAATGGRSYRFNSRAFLLNQTASTTVAGGQQIEGDCLILGEAPPADVYAPGCPTTDPSDDRVAPALTQGTAPGDLSSQQLGSVSLSAVPANQAVSAGNWVVSAVPLTRSHAMQLAVELP